MVGTGNGGGITEMYGAGCVRPTGANDVASAPSRTRPAHRGQWKMRWISCITLHDVDFTVEAASAVPIAVLRSYKRACVYSNARLGCVTKTSNALYSKYAVYQSESPARATRGQTTDEVSGKCRAWVMLVCQLWTTNYPTGACRRVTARKQPTHRRPILSTPVAAAAPVNVLKMVKSA